MIHTEKMKGKIEYCLEKWAVCRNSDKKLIAFVWYTFFQKLLFKDADGDWCVKIKNIMHLPSTETIRRVRQKFQAENKYLADSDVKQERMMREVDMRHEMVKPVNEIDL